MNNISIIVITGLSGAGKSTAAKVLEDNGYYTIDNMPLAIIEHFIEVFFELGVNINKLCLVIDARSGNEERLNVAITMLRNRFDAKIIYLTAKEDIIIKRYKESRRIHPLGTDLIDSIKREEALMSQVKSIADYIVDTSTLNVHELTRQLNSFLKENGNIKFVINLCSFGFKNGIPLDTDLLFDVRFLKNPHFIDSMRHRTGLEEDVSNYVFSDPATLVFMEKLVDLLNFLIPQYKNEGKRAVKISIGCTGGRHRSVAIVEKLGLIIKALAKVEIKHRDINL